MGYQIAVFIHILAAITWLGGSLFLVMVMVPLTRQAIEGAPPGFSVRLLRETAIKFRNVAWASIVLLVITGLFIATDHFDVSVSDLFDDDSRFISILRTKAGFVVLIIVLSFLHDFILGPRLTRQIEELDSPANPPDSIRRARVRLVWIARVNLVLLLVVLGLAVTMTRGNPF